jgi:putative membrane protein
MAPRGLPIWLAAVYAGIWLLAAVDPVDREAWLLENSLAVVAAGALAITHRRFAFSDLSYTLIFAFLVLHTVGAHYTYSRVPIGNSLRDVIGLERNPYDRVVHLAFGLLLAGPLRELVLRRLHVHRVASYVLPVLIVLALSSGYEIIESWAARSFDPELGIAYVGAQGDIWDSQKDMSLALCGAALAMLLAWGWRRRSGHEPFLPPARRAGEPDAPP